MGKTCCGKSVVKYTEIDKRKKNPMFYFECVILFIHITKQSPVKFFSAPKRRKSVVKILKLIKHSMSCFEYRVLASLSLLGGQDKMISSGVARAFPGGRLPHPEGQNEEENE